MKSYSWKIQQCNFWWEKNRNGFLSESTHPNDLGHMIFNIRVFFRLKFMESPVSKCLSAIKDWKVCQS